MSECERDSSCQDDIKESSVEVCHRLWLDPRFEYETRISVTGLAALMAMKWKMENPRR